MKNQIQQLTSAADNALRLLDQMAKLEPFELSSAARELVRDASAPLRNALRSLTLKQDASPEEKPQGSGLLTRGQLGAAVETLADTERGRNALRSLLAFITSGGDGLDCVNQGAALTILRCQFGPFAGSTRDEIKNALRKWGAETPGTTLALALDKAEAFVSGFEDDESQEGIPELLALIRKAQRAI